MKQLVTAFVFFTAGRFRNLFFKYNFPSAKVFCHILFRPSNFHRV